MGRSSQAAKMSSQGKVEVTRGVFDPRTYKTVDKDNWARKRKPEWMSTTGQIHYVRERQVVPTTHQQEEKEEAPLEASRATTPTKEVKAPAPVVTTSPGTEGTADTSAGLSRSSGFLNV